MAMPAAQHPPVRLLVRTRRTLGSDGSSEVDSMVFCPLLARSVPTDLCEHCTRFVTRGPRAVNCRIELPRDDGRERVDVAEAAARTLVGEVMSRDAVVVREDAPVALAVALVDGGSPVVPVVAGQARLVGVITPEIAMRSLHDQARPHAAGPLATQPETVLGEATPVSLALGALAVARDCAVPVVSAAGAVVGTLSQRDLVGWVARRMGYEEPPRED
jgi:hypothetical protein